MELSDLITKDSDRLFILDNECYVIFTGDSIEDDRPFIRIGNWINLPVEIIPLIENIIVTDMIIGNPSLEQFNIDINYLPKNRYIGSRLIVKRYLDFQKNFGLDLNNAAVVDIEKDIPEYSREKIISDRDSFIGVFYTDGNFRITHNKTNIFNLQDMDDLYYHDKKIHDTLSRHGKESSRYAGSGFVITGNSPMFYKNKYFSTYQFPRNYFEAFSRLCIDPGQIRELILPSANIMNATRFLKWKHASKGRIKIFSDHSDAIDLLQRLYSGATIIRQAFRGSSFDTGDGLNISNYTDTFNIRCTYKNIRPSQEPISIAYIKGYKGIQQVLKNGLDAVFVPCTVYEDTNLFFKSARCSVIIIDDGNKNISRIEGGPLVIIYPDVQYEFLKYAAPEKLADDLSAAIWNGRLSDIIENRDFDTISGMLSRYGSEFEVSSLEDKLSLFNALALLKLHYATATDRKTAASIKKCIDDGERRIRKRSFISSTPGIRINLVFCGGNVFEVAEKIDDTEKDRGPALLNEISADREAAAAATTDPHLRSYYEKVIDDRERLMQLLKLFAPRQKNQKDIYSLKEAINKIRDQYQADEIEREPSDIRCTLATMRIKKSLKIAVIPLIIILLLLLGHTGHRAYRGYQAQQQKKAVEKERRRIVKEYGIHVSDRDIFEYANRVAIMNGYAPIPFASMKDKNPNWIFPGNVFTMLDGQHVTVKPGDTLWAIAHGKLMEMSLNFYKRVETIKRGMQEGKDMRLEIQNAGKFAYTDEHRRLLESLLKTASAR